MITVRRASVADTQRIFEIAEETIFPSWTPAYVQSRLERDDTLLFAAEQHECGSSGIVGFAACRQVGDDGELLQIAVAASAQRRGAGSLLLGAVIDQARKNALNSIFLEVRAGNSPALSLYKKYGFTKVRTRRNYYTDPTEDAIIMSLPIFDNI